MAITNALNTAVSGLQSATNKVAGSATNIANLRSVANPSTSPDRATTDDEGRALFNPVRFVDQTLPNSGVLSTAQLVDPSAVQEYDPRAADADADGFVNRPGFSLEQEQAQLITSTRQFEANLATVRAADSLLESTLDIIS